MRTCVAGCLSVAGLCLSLGWGMAQAQAQAQSVLPPPTNVLSLSSSATLEVPQDWLSVGLNTVREGADAATVQAQLKQALDAALVEARKAVKAGQIEVRTGGFSVYPRYAPKGGISGWQGSAELVVEGRDTAAIAQLAGRLTTLSISRVAYSLSREAREKVEADVAAQAITRFRAQAEAYARQFGFAGYAIREVNVASASDTPVPQPRFRTSMAAAPVADTALPTEAGKANVTATVNGSVQMSIR